MANRKPIWMWIAIGVGFLALLAIVFWPGPADSMARVKRRVAELELEAKARKLPRSVLVGTPIPGNAWDEYNLAIRDAWVLEVDGKVLPVLLERGDRASLEAVTAHSESLKHVLDGAQRSDGQYLYRWEEGCYGLEQLSTGPAALKVAGLAAGQARVLLDSGQPKESVKQLLAVATFGRDFTAQAFFSSDGFGVQIYLIALHGIRDVLLSGELSRNDAADLASKLEILEREVPKMSPVLANELCSTGRILVDFSERDLTFSSWGDIVKTGGWRYVLFPRKIGSDAFELRDAFLKRAQALDKLDYAAARKEAVVIQTEVNSSNLNTVLPTPFPDLPFLLESNRSVKARLRLLQAAALYRATGRKTTLPDPFGTALYVVEEGDKIRIWSVGPDGTNENGVGGWKNPVRGADLSEVPGTDIVIDLPK